MNADLFSAFPWIASGNFSAKDTKKETQY